MIDIIFQTVKAFLNTNGRGNFKPVDFNLFLNNAVLEIYNLYITDINQKVNRENRGLINGGLENSADRVREKLQHYLNMETVSPVGGAYTLPVDYKSIDVIKNALGASFEPCKNREEFEIIKNTVGTTEFPIYLKSGNTIETFPSTTDDLLIYYIRMPRFAKWTFLYIQNAEVFNPSAPDFVDVDIHPEDQTEVIVRVCQKFGVNLKENDITAYFQMKEAEKQQQQNIS